MGLSNPTGANAPTTEGQAPEPAPETYDQYARRVLGVDDMKRGETAMVGLGGRRPAPPPAPTPAPPPSIDITVEEYVELRKADARLAELQAQQQPAAQQQQRDIAETKRLQLLAHQEQAAAAPRPPEPAPETYAEWTRRVLDVDTIERNRTPFGLTGRRRS